VQLEETITHAADRVRETLFTPARAREALVPERPLYANKAKTMLQTAHIQIVTAAV
jgi:hypothetical protein